MLPLLHESNGLNLFRAVRNFLSRPFSSLEKLAPPRDGHAITPLLAFRETLSYCCSGQTASIAGSASSSGLPVTQAVISVQNAPAPTEAGIKSDPSKRVVEAS